MDKAMLTCEMDCRFFNLPGTTMSLPRQVMEYLSYRYAEGDYTPNNKKRL